MYLEKHQQKRDEFLKTQWDENQTAFILHSMTAVVELKC